MDKFKHFEKINGLKYLDIKIVSTNKNARLIRNTNLIDHV